MAHLTKDTVLHAVDEAIAPFSAYINDVVQRKHARSIRAGGTGHSPTAALVLRRLRQLEADGLVKCIGGPRGLYGFSWRITEAGRRALKDTHHE